LNVPLDLALERNFDGPLLTTTVWRLRPVKRHVTVVPFLTVTVGTPLARTK
jgi:hypothetical protein